MYELIFLCMGVYTCLNKNTEFNERKIEIIIKKNKYGHVSLSEHCPENCCPGKRRSGACDENSGLASYLCAQLRFFVIAKLALYQSGYISGKLMLHG